MDRVTLVGSMNGWSKNGHERATTVISGGADEPVLIRLPDDATPSWPPPGDVWPDAPVDEYDLERPRLEAEIASAKARAAAARHRAAQREAEVHAALREELLASQELVAEMEREHDAAVAAVLEAGRVDAARIVAAAREAAQVSRAE